MCQLDLPCSAAKTRITNGLGAVGKREREKVCEEKKEVKQESGTILFQKDLIRNREACEGVSCWGEKAAGGIQEKAAQRGLCGTGPQPNPEALTHII